MKTEKQVLDFIEKNDLANGEKVIFCYLKSDSFEFYTKNQGLVKVKFNK